MERHIFRIYFEGQTKSESVQERRTYVAVMKDKIISLLITF